MATSRLGIIENQATMEWQESIWRFDQDDWALIAMLQDPVHCAELLFEDPKRYEYGGCYHVEDYQYPLFRNSTTDEGRPTARSVGKTESIKARGVSHAFRRQAEDLLLSAPYMIHLKPLTQAVESRIRDTRLTREFLDTRGQKTGFTHDPFQVDFLDGTKIVGRIPLLTGAGVKGMHEPDAMIDEAQDYPEKGWIEIAPTLMRDHRDIYGNPDYSFLYYGVHTGSRESNFYKLTHSGEFKITQITAMMRPGWGPEEKRKWAALYGGTQSSDYRRNILGEAGGSSSAFFVTAHLMACIDQKPDSDYNTRLWKRQEFKSEDMRDMLGDIPDKAERKERTLELLRSQLDLPELGQQVFIGADIGLVNDPTVITLWDIGPHINELEKPRRTRQRLRLMRMFHLWRFTEQEIRQVAYVIGWRYGKTLRGAGWDVSGLGLPIFQAMEADDVAPQHLLDVSRGYTFSTKVPIGIDKTLVIKDSQGNMRDHLGNIVEIRKDPFTGEEDHIVRMSMIEASTRYLRDDIDTNFMLLPFDTQIADDFQGETEQRVKAMAGIRKKPNSFHILDSARAFAMARHAAEVEEQIAVRKQTPVMARAMDINREEVALGGR